MNICSGNSSDITLRDFIIWSTHQLSLFGQLVRFLHLVLFFVFLFQCELLVLGLSIKVMFNLFVKIDLEFFISISKYLGPFCILVWTNVKPVSILLINYSSRFFNSLFGYKQPLKVIAWWGLRDSLHSNRSKTQTTSN